MITIFWLLVSALILIAFLIILPPLWRKRIIPANDQDQRNITIASQRLAELKAQLEAGTLSRDQYEEQFAELEAALNDDLEIGQPISKSATQGRWMVYVLVLALPIAALSLYAVLGNYRALSVTAAAPTPEMAQINDMVAGLAERLKNQPDDVKGWLMLGRSYKYLQQYPKSAEAFGHAYQLLGDQPEVMLLYAEALAFTNNEQLAGKPAELVFKALAMEPENPAGLWFGGMAKAQTGDFVAARRLWKKLEALLPAGSEAQQEVQGLLAKLATQMPEGAMPAAESKPEPAAETGSTGSTAAASIDLEVSLAPEFEKSANPEDTVFVYAKALSGPQMPLAIVRKKVADLPLKVNLNDSMAMMPATARDGGSVAIGREPMRPMKLSNFGQVKLLARISKSGNAIQQPGDLIGIIEPVAVSGSGIHKIEIKDTVK